LTQIHSHIFRFVTPSDNDSNKLSNNIISIIEEDAKKHYINYIHYYMGDDDNIFTREVNIKVDRYYYLEIANSSIDDVDRKKRLFTIIGKRCFGQNDHKMDCYFLEQNQDLKEILQCFDKHKQNPLTHPILHEVITHTINKYEAYLFFCKDRYYSVIKQTNISSRKTFEKSFLVQMNKSDYTKLTTYQTNELKIDYIFNLIGKIYFNQQPLIKKKSTEIDYSPDVIINKKLEEISDGLITNKTFLNKELFDSLRAKRKDIENVYFSFLSRALKFIHEPDNEETIFLFSDTISDAVELIEDEELLEEVVSFLELLKIIIKEKKISYIISKKDQDIKDIFIFMLEMVTAWNSTIHQDNIDYFNRATIDLYNILRHFTDKYFKFYYDYKSIDAKSKNEEVKESNKKKDKEECKENILEEQKTSSAEFFSSVNFDIENLDEVSELQSELESSLYTDTPVDILESKSHAFLQSCTHMLNKLYEFQNIAYVLSILDEQIGRLLNLSDNTKAIDYFKTIIEDLVDWKNEVFVERSSNDIYSIENSLYLHIAQLDIYIEDGES